jgi:hypothetical protein
MLSITPDHSVDVFSCLLSYAALLIFCCMSEDDASKHNPENETTPRIARLKEQHVIPLVGKNSISTFALLFLSRLQAPLLR